MLNLRQLAKRTSEDRKQRSLYVKITGMKAGYTKGGLGYVAAKTQSTHVVNAKGRLVRNPEPHQYITMITFIDNKLHCHVSCSCSDLTYRWEWANANKGAGEIEYSNGDAPDTNNPGYKPSLCKHLFRLYEKIKPKLPPGT